MPRYNLTDPKGAAELLADIDFTINDTSQGTFSPDHVAYHCSLTSGSDTHNKCRAASDGLSQAGHEQEYGTIDVEH